MRLRWLPLLALVLILGFTRPALAQEGTPDAENQLYFAETGHWVTGEFLRAYQNVSDPHKIYGYPITEAFQDQTIGRIVQYFERARFELFSENLPELRVHISPLGQYLYTPGEPLPIPENFPACRLFPETGFQVCYAFLEFFEENGGAAQLGYPISNFEVHDGRIVQYFQRARMEWHPELPQGERVILSDLGRIYFNLRQENPARLLPAAVRDNRPQDILSLQASAFPRSAVLPRSGTQTIFIIVQDQNLQPVSDAKATLVIRLPGGREERLAVPGQTDKDGILKFDYTFRDQNPGLATVSVEVAYDRLSTKTQTSFRIWW